MVRLPGLSGLDLQRQFTQGDVHVPIILITAHGDIPMTVRAMKAGAIEFLPKPFRDQDLLDANQQAVERDRASREQRAKVIELRERLRSLTPREREYQSRPPALYQTNMPQRGQSYLKNHHCLSIHKDAIMHSDNVPGSSNSIQASEEGRGRPQGSPGSLLRVRNFRYLLALVVSCLALVLIFFVAPAQARAATGGPSLQVSAGFETRYRQWELGPGTGNAHNDGADFNGVLSLSAPVPQFLVQSNTLPTSAYQLPVALPNGTQKQVTLNIPLYYDVQSVTAKLLNGGGNVAVTQTATLNPLLPADVFVGILSDQSSGFGPLSATPLPDQSGSVALDFLNASTMPAIPALLKNFDVIVLDDPTTGTLGAAQLTALQSWVQQGGTLLLHSVPEGQRTLNALPVGLVLWHLEWHNHPPVRNRPATSRLARFGRWTK